MSGDHKRFSEAGFAVYLAKPFLVGAPPELVEELLIEVEKSGC